MARYELANTADEDFEHIFEFGIDTFGLAQAIDYQQSMTKRFEELADQPNLYQEINAIRSEYCRSVYRSHSIYYKIEPSHVFIVRILGQQEPTKTLE